MIFYYACVKSGGIFVVFFWTSNLMIGLWLEDIYGHTSLSWYEILVIPIRISLIEGCCKEGNYWTKGSSWLSWSHHFESFTGQKDKQRSTKHTHKTKDRVTRAPLKTWGELRCSGRVRSSCSTSGTRGVNLVTTVIRHLKSD
jgi:hypothetical protein